ncbi:lipase [Arcanobacterium haemolyticum]|nr:lipase [Arcanobacterium haemolyticum]
MPGTGEDAFATWAFYAPELVARGLCVYTFNYNPSVKNLRTGQLDEAAAFSGNIMSSAAFMSGFVDRVLESTGADKVDLIGHSQGGGPLPRAYIKYFGGNDKVRHLVGLTPSNRGTTVWGITKLIERAERDGVINGVYLGDQAADINTAQYGRDKNIEALGQQMEGSPFITALNEGGMTFEGIEYTVIATKLDDVVTPYTNSFLDAAENVTNITIQDVCAWDHTDHLGATYDPVSFEVAYNALYPEYAAPVTCRYVPPIIQ